MTHRQFVSRAIALALVSLLVLAAFTGTAAADSRTGGTVVVPAGETVTGGLNAAGGTIEIYGTVQGNLQAAGGTVVVAQGGTVTGNVQATGGDVRIDGTVNGDATIASGNAVVGPNATVHGDLKVGAGSAIVAGTVDGTATVGANTIVLAPTANIGGDFVYNGNLDRQAGSQVGGTVRQDPNIGAPGVPIVPQFPSWAGTVYGFLVNLVIGAVLLTAFPRFSGDVADRFAHRVLPSAGWGLLVLIGAPIVLVVVAITIIGIPLAIAGIIVYALLLWAAAVYGQYALGAWLLSFTASANRYLALLVGAVILAVVQFVPFLNVLVGIVLLVLALGALAAALYGRYRGRETAVAEPTA